MGQWCSPSKATQLRFDPFVENQKTGALLTSEGKMLHKAGAEKVLFLDPTNLTDRVCSMAITRLVYSMPFWIYAGSLKMTFPIPYNSPEFQPVLPEERLT